VGEIPESDIEVVGVGSAGFSGTGWEKRGDRRGTYGSGSDVYGGHVFGSSTRSAGGAAASREAGAPRDVAATPTRIRRDESKASETFAKGDHVSHKTFGPGVVLSAEGDTIEVRFSRIGKTKKLMKGFAPIVKIEG
jgi:DNA helicase-2/ATP-dependent DNA helicase PcrA